MILPSRVLASITFATAGGHSHGGGGGSGGGGFRGGGENGDGGGGGIDDGVEDNMVGGGELGDGGDGGGGGGGRGVGGGGADCRGVDVCVSLRRGWRRGDYYRPQRLSRREKREHKEKKKQKQKQKRVGNDDDDRALDVDALTALVTAAFTRRYGRRPRIAYVTCEGRQLPPTMTAESLFKTQVRTLLLSYAGTTFTQTLYSHRTAALTHTHPSYASF
jgi:hypothetical protein